MALPRPQTVTIPLVGGIDESVDARVLPAPNLLKAQNVLHTTAGLLEKRPGFSGTADWTSDINKIIVTGSELLVANSSTVPCLVSGYTFSDTYTSHKNTGSYIPRGYLPEAVGWRRPIISGSGPAQTVAPVNDGGFGLVLPGDGAYSELTGGILYYDTVVAANGLVVHVWAQDISLDTTGGPNFPQTIAYSVEDETGVVIKEGVLISSARITKVVTTAVANAVFIFYYLDGYTPTAGTQTLYWASLNVTDPNAITELTQGASLFTAVQYSAQGHLPLAVTPIYGNTGSALANGILVSWFDATGSPAALRTGKYNIVTYSDGNYGVESVGVVATDITGIADITAVANWGQTSGGSETATSWVVFADKTNNAIKAVGYRQDTLVATTAVHTVWSTSVQVYNSTQNLGRVHNITVARISGTAIKIAISAWFGAPIDGTVEENLRDLTVIMEASTAGATTPNTTVLYDFQLRTKLFSTTPLYTTALSAPVVYVGLYASMRPSTYDDNGDGLGFTTQGGYHIIDTAFTSFGTAREVCRLAPRQATDRYARFFPSNPTLADTLSTVSAIGTNSQIFSALVDTSLGVGSLFAFYVDFGEPASSNLPGNGCGLRKWKTLPLGNNTTFICGGVPSIYDGVYVHELGFAAYPDSFWPVAETRNYIISPTGYEYPGNGPYAYVFVWSFDDSGANLHRSAPASITSTGDPIYEAPDASCYYLNAPTLQLTSKYGPGSPYSPITTNRSVYVDVYRSIGTSGSTYYFLTRLKSPANRPYVYFFDGIPDSAIDQNPVLYTTGGVQETHAPPSCTDAILHRNCVWIAGCDDPRQIWISKPLEYAIVPEFNDDRVLFVPEPVVAIQNMDSCVYAFSTSTIYRIVGEPPNATGAGGSLQNPEALPNSFGCVNPRSVVLIEDGIVFESARGLMLLDRGGYVKDFHNIQTTLDEFPVIQDAILDTTLRHSNLVLSVKESEDSTTGRLLVRDQATKNWSVWKIQDGTSIDSLAIHNGRLVAAPGQEPYALVCGAEDSTCVSDLGEWIEMRIKTPEVHLADLVGFQRVWKCKALGRGQSPCIVHMDEYTDYGASANQTLELDLTAGTDAKTELELYFSHQRCQSASVEIYDEQPTDWNGTTGGEGISWNAAAFEVGVEARPNRTNPSNRVG